MDDVLHAVDLDRPTDAAALRHVPAGKCSTPTTQTSGMSCLGAFSPAAVLGLECGWARD
jgi:hypothetical protein